MAFTARCHIMATLWLECIFVKSSNCSVTGNDARADGHGGIGVDWFLRRVFEEQLMLEPEIIQVGPGTDPPRELSWVFYAYTDSSVFTSLISYVLASMIMSL
jgi:hypothetical protein